VSEAAAFILGVRSQALLAQALAVAASLGIADLLDDGPLEVAELARRCGADPDTLFRLLRTLAGHGVFAADTDGRFRLTERAGPLRRTAPDSVYPLLAGAFPPLVWSAYGELEAAIRTGDVAFDRAHGASFFDYLAAHPPANMAFDHAMQMVAAAENPLIAAAFNFRQFAMIADIGGGQGGLLAAILAREPGPRGLLFDQPQVLAVPAALAAAGLLDRCELVPGDFFAAVPAGADLYLFKRILHDWDDERALAILRNCRKAAGARGRILVIDAVMQPGNAPDPNKDLDLSIMALTGGRERTAAEFAALLAAADFQLETVHPLPPPATLSMVEARPA
jgi:hypothetical protein